MEKKRVSFYVTPKNGLVWCSVLFLLFSVSARIAYVCEKGADQTTMWFQVVLPIAAALLYAAIILFDGREHFYRTAIPVFLVGLYLAQRALSMGMLRRYVLLHWVLYLAIFFVYRYLTAGKNRRIWILWLMLLAICGYFVVEARNLYRVGMTPLRYLFELPNLLLSIGILCATLAMKEHADGKYHPTWGDRPDGRRLHDLDPMSQVANYIMPRRNGASNLFRESVEISAMERFIREKRLHGMPNLGVTEIFLAAYVRCAARYPAINRFLSGQHVYSRDEDIQFCMVIKKEMNKEAPETVIKLHLSPRDTLPDIYEKFHKAVEEVHNTPLDSAFDNTARALTYLPGVLLKFAIWFLGVMDYFGLIPKFLLEVSPFHGSVFFTSMGSLGIPPVFHHLYDFGNLPVFCAFGCKQRKQEILPSGEMINRKYIDFTLTLDERIVDGFYYAEVCKYFRRLLRDPSVLEEQPAQVVRDVD